jgi:hypothetical protein
MKCPQKAYGRDKRPKSRPGLPVIISIFQALRRFYSKVSLARILLDLKLSDRHRVENPADFRILGSVRFVKAVL